MGAAGTAAAELAPQLSPQQLGSWRRGSWQAAACRAAQLYRQLASCRHSSVNIRLPAQLQLRHWGTDPTLMSLSSYRRITGTYPCYPLGADCGVQVRGPCGPSAGVRRLAHPAPRLRES